MALFTFILCILFVKLVLKYHRVKCNDITENGISVTKISKFAPIISLDILESSNDNTSYSNTIYGDTNSLKSINITPSQRNSLEPNDNHSHKRHSAESMKLSKSSARSFSEVFEDLNKMNLDKVIENVNKVNDNNSNTLEPNKSATQRPPIMKSMPLEIENLKEEMIVNKRIQKNKPNPEDRILKKIDSSIIMFKGEPIYNITKNSDKPGEYKL